MGRPEQTTPEMQWTLSLIHQVCVKYAPQNQAATIKCKVKFAPSLLGKKRNYKVSEILGLAAQDKAPAFPEIPQLSSLKLRSSSVEYFLPDLFALVSVMLAVLGLRKLHIFKKPVGGLKEPLMHV